MRTRRLALALALALLSCSERSAPSPAMQAAAPPAPPAAAAGSPAEALPAASRAMRITVEATVVVSDLDAAVQALRRAAAGQGGYVSEARLTGSTGRVRSAFFEVKVPAARLDAFRAEMAKLGEIVSEAEKAEDVTEQRADIGARVRNAHAQEQRLLALLSNRTGNLADVVAVEKELAAVRESIERFEAQQRVLEGQIALATVAVQLATRWEEAPIGAWGRIASAGGEGLHSARQLLVGLAVAALAYGPSLAILCAIGFGGFLAIRWLARRRRKSPAPAPPPAA
jgi:hypothetical protein